MSQVNRREQWDSGAVGYAGFEGPVLGGAAQRGEAVSCHILWRR